MTDPNVLDQLMAAIARKKASAGSTRAFKNLARRLCRQLDEIDVRSPKTMLLYRRQMAVGTRAIFGTVFRMFQETEAGAGVPDLERLPPVFLPHPLSASVMHLGALLGNERLPEAIWGRAVHAFGWDQSATNAAWRIRHWFMGSDAVVEQNTPLVVKDAAGRPMQPWMIDAIINSGTWARKVERTTDQTRIAALLEETINIAFIGGTGAEELRWVCDRVAGMKPKKVGEAKKKLALVPTAADPVMALLEWANELPAETVGEEMGQW